MAHDPAVPTSLAALANVDRPTASPFGFASDMTAAVPSADRQVPEGLVDSSPFMRALCRRGSPPKRAAPAALGTTQDQTSAAISIRRVARLSRNVGQPNHIVADPIISHKAERRPGSGEIWLAVTKHDGVQVDSILIDQAKFGEALRQGGASNFDLPVAVGLQLADRALKIIINKPGVGAYRLQRARDD